jgi:hypothetical protein
MLHLVKNIYFYRVKHFSHSMGKKIIAGLLLALLVFIQAGKVFHTHEKENASSCHSVALASGNTGCSICEFQLSKDSELPVLEHLATSFIYLPKETHFFSCFSSCATPDLIPGRGPPPI